MAEGKANTCEECGQTFDNRLKGFLTIRLRQLARDVEEKIDELFRQDSAKAPPAVEYYVFLTALFASHGIKGQALQHPEAISAKRRCLVQCPIPTLDLKSSFLEFNSSDFYDQKVLALIAFSQNSQLGRFMQAGGIQARVWT